MDIARIRQMSDTELEDALRQAKQDLWSARFALSTRQLNDTSSIPQTRHAIARIMTVQRERGVSRPAGASRPATAAAGRPDTARASRPAPAGRSSGRAPS